MAVRLYPPNVAGTLPSFYTDDLQGTVLTVPFSMNKTVSAASVKGFRLRIKTASTDTLVGNVDSSNWNKNETALQITFKIPNEIASKLRIGTFYKIQIAYIDNRNILGYYSSISIVKYTSQPTVSIVNLNTFNTNFNSEEYVGQYINKQDTSEKVLRYKFTLFDGKDNVIETSDWQLHNSYEDESLSESIDFYHIKTALKEDIQYKIQYSILTNNELIVNSPKYVIMQASSINPELLAEITTTMNYDGGFIEVGLTKILDDRGYETAATGSYILSRADSKNNYAIWHPVHNFRLTGELPSDFLFRDFTVESGITYKYSLQQYNDAKVYSNRTLTSEITAYFEDAFLYDGTRQLKLKFNPKLASFKEVVSESKKTTIGGKFPIITRNGAMNYKEFQISGLISNLMDDQELFLNKKEDLAIDTTYLNKHDITDENLTLERKFKLEVLSWLNNGEVKLFRSPQEGNYIVRLMNINMVPNDTLSRMLHTFNGMATEIAEYNTDSLAEYGLLTVGEIETRQMRWSTIILADWIEEQIRDQKVYKRLIEEYNVKFEEIINDPLLSDNVKDSQLKALETERLAALTKSIKSDFVDAAGNLTPMAINHIQSIDLARGYPCYHLKAENMTLGSILTLGENEIMIGATGQYEVAVDTPYNTLHLMTPRRGMPGSITYAIMSTVSNKFDSVRQITITDIVAHPTYGPEEDLLSCFRDTEHEISSVYYMQFSLKDIQPIDDSATDLIYDNRTGNYLIIEPESPDGYTPVAHRYNVYTLYTTANGECYIYDPELKVLKPVGTYDSSIDFDGVLLDINETKGLLLTHLDPIPTKVKLGNAVYATTGLQVRNIRYSVTDLILEEKEARDEAYRIYQMLLMQLKDAGNGDDIMNYIENFPDIELFIYEYDIFRILSKDEVMTYFDIAEQMYVQVGANTSALLYKLDEEYTTKKQEIYDSDMTGEDKLKALEKLDAWYEETRNELQVPAPYYTDQQILDAKNRYEESNAKYLKALDEALAEREEALLL